MVRRECRSVDPAGSSLGCQISRAVVLDDGTTLKVVKIVRYTDRLPSPIAFEIDVHELCHAIASVQNLFDPCHDDDELIETALPRRSLGRF